MNQTQHQRWVYRSAGLQALIDNQQHTIKTPMVVAVAVVANSVGLVPGETEQQLVREGRICFTQIGTSLA